MLTEENKERIRLWVAALRSGEFEQGKKCLRTGDKFCCLGVACEVYRRETGDGMWVQDNNYFAAYNARAAQDTETAGYMHVTVAEWLGFDNQTNPYLDTEHTAAEYNDTGASFDWIANRIEKRYLS